ncbi:MAG: tetratricopeptide repeat protein [Burkholderiales bacterium]|nr:tetratricopeptide repeat protein [Burkholderiales bacterium]
MAVYDLEEQDQIDDLKAWWNRWGNVVTTVAVVAAIAFAGMQGWRWWTAKQAEEASALFSAMTQAARANDLPKAKDAATQLADRFAGTGYAPRAALVAAKMMFDAGDKAGARAQLAWVIERAGETELKEIARYRMAELLLDDRKYDEALAMLDAKHGDTFAALYADLRGDALSAAGRTADARVAYELAYSKFDEKSPYRNYVQVKLESLGGAPAAQGTGSAAITLPPAGAAPAAAPATPPSAPAPAVPKK